MHPQTIVDDSALIQARACQEAPDQPLVDDAIIPQRTYVTGIIVALAGIFAFFMALVSAYVVRKGSGDDWRHLALPGVLWLNTAVLIGSSLTLIRSRRRLAAGDETGSRQWWGVTAVLGVLFLCGQLIAWRQLAAAGIYLATNPSGSFFYLLTAAHGVHLLGGVIALLFVAFRPTRYLGRGTATKVISLYWHSMAGLWIFLFLLFLRVQ